MKILLHNEYSEGFEFCQISSQMGAILIFIKLAIRY
jgi:hypothetical protein